ncbi:MAG: ribonuclease Y [Candidatus Electryonea clarkiae]|nr:ribonuclease Y [Candidatus Electryonea clarkiae]MDP8287166.1 ribonuclease Y [Candidatus Electryonea clarkiae]
MDTFIFIIIAGVIGIIVGTVSAHFIKSLSDRSKKHTEENQAESIIETANKEAESLKKEKLLEARDEALALKYEQDKEHNKKNNETRSLERKLRDREVTLNKRYERIRLTEREQRDKDKELNRAYQSINGKEERLKQIVDDKEQQLQKIAGMSSEEALEQLKVTLIDKARRQTAEQVKQMRDKARLEANREAKEIIIQAIQRSAADHSSENTVTALSLPNDEIKGRIIGREGRNIRALETATGVDIIVDDTPEAVILSSFDPYRREVARISLEKLINDGRIHPGRIEEIVEKAKKELEERVLELGQNALIEANVHGVRPELVKYLGRLHYRTSYGQNVLKHVVEVAHLSGLMASELGLDGKKARRAGLLHDIGKAIDREAEGTHVQLGLDLLKKYGEGPVIQNALAAHHEDTPFNNPISVLVQAADAISGSRPGARRETLENYIQRMESLEEIATSFDGVNRVFAIQAGREIRVIVENQKVSDAVAEALANDIAEKIEAELEYPGQIRVTVIREYRAIGYAK